MKEYISYSRTSSGYSDKRTSSKYVVDSNNSSNYIDSGANYIDDSRNYIDDSRNYIDDSRNYIDDSRNYVDDSRNYIDDPLNYIADKGQLISKFLFGVFILPKNKQ